MLHRRYPYKKLTEFYDIFHIANHATEIYSLFLFLKSSCFWDPNLVSLNCGNNFQLNAALSSKSTPLPTLFMQKGIVGKNKIRFCKSSEAHSGRIQWADALCWWDGNGPPWAPSPRNTYTPIPQYHLAYSVHISRSSRACRCLSYAIRLLAKYWLCAPKHEWKRASLTPLKWR